ncbi:MAG: DNA alkylation repair protein [Clostridia bacterium]|nr:DNA alkylation repair protein [Clostridia bacterium]
MTFVRTELAALADQNYREFNSKLMPTVEKSTVFGVRTPVLRKFAKEFFKDPSSKEFLTALPHKYFEENQLHAFLVEQIKDFDRCILAVEAFLPFVDNWATCDCFSPAAFKKEPDRLLPYIEKWLTSSHVYTARYGVVMLMRYFLDGRFDEKHLKTVADLPTDDYYLSMAVAWYFATALAKQYDVALPYIQDRLLDKATHNRAIQKAIESLRISEKHKAYLKTLRIK